MAFVPFVLCAVGMPSTRAVTQIERWKRYLTPFTNGHMHATSGHMASSSFSTQWT